jgi:hypothetical protein
MVMNMNYKEVIATQNPSWEEEIKELVKTRIKFVLVGWKYEHDNQICENIAVENHYQYRFDPSKDRAFFEPKQV